MRLYFFLTLSLFSQNWHSFHDETFSVEFPKKQIMNAQKVFGITKLLIPKLTKFMDCNIEDLKKEPLRLILTDSKDISNGYAISKNIVIYVESSAYIENWTSDYDWYYRVVAHELVHHIMYRVISRGTQKLGFAFQYLTSDMPPRWFTEGLAQYAVEKWDYFRSEKTLKDAIFENRFTYNHMMKDIRLAYAGGHAFLRFLADKYGFSSIKKVMAYDHESQTYSFNKAMNQVYKKSIRELFIEFNKSLIIYFGLKYQNFKNDTLSLKKVFPSFFSLYDMKIWNSKKKAFVVLARVKQDEAHTKLIKMDKDGVFETIAENVANFSVDTINKLILFSKRILQNQYDDLYLRTDWYLHDELNGSTKKLIESSKSINAIISYPDIIYIEQEKNYYKIVRKNVEGGAKKEKLIKDVSLGRISKYDKQIVIEGQNKRTGRRALYTLAKDGIIEFFNHKNHDLRNIKAIHENGIDFIVNIISESKKKVLLKYANNHVEEKSFFNDFDIVLYDKKESELYLRYSFFKRSQIVKTKFEGLEKKEIKVFNRKNFLSKNTKLSVPAYKISDSHPVPEKLSYPQFNYDHFLSLALPYYNKNGFNLFALNVLSEPLDRFRSLTLLNYDFNEKNRSFLVSQQNAKLAGFGFTLKNMILPQIFNLSKEKLTNRFHSSLSISKNWYINNNNNLLKLKLGLNREFLNRKSNDIEYYGLSASIAYQYKQFYLHDRFIESEKFLLKNYFFKSFGDKYNFYLNLSTLSIRYSLFSNLLYLKSDFNYIRQNSSNSNLMFTGIDYYYQYDIPKDFGYSRGLRGFRRNLFSNNLIWSSNEIKFFLLKNAAFKILFIPVNKLTLDLFRDYAEAYDRDRKISSYGYQLSILYPYFEIQGGKWYLDSMENVYNDWFLRISLNYDIN